VTSTSLPENYPRYYTPGQVAAWAGVTSMTIIRWCDAGILKAVTTPGGHRRITEESVRNYLVERGLPIPDEFGPKKAPPPPRIIIVDDEPRALRALVNRFKKFVEISSFSDGYRAMAAACADPPAALVIDMILPEMNGEKMIRALREEPRTSKLPIIAWSHDANQLEAAKRAGATHVFSKDAVDDVERVLKAIAEPIPARATRRLSVVVLRFGQRRTCFHTCAPFLFRELKDSGN
jgi:excisionase family DNA binding protein